MSELKINGKTRLDQYLVNAKLVLSRSQAESYIKLGKVTVNGNLVKRAGTLVGKNDEVKLSVSEQYVSRAGLKLKSVANNLGVDFKEKTVLDVGSSTGGFTDFALRQGARKVIAVELGKDQMHPSLLSDPRIELHQKTDIRDYAVDTADYWNDPSLNNGEQIDIVLTDISFMSLRDILPSVMKIISNSTLVLAMVKPQFEADNSNYKHKGVVKNEKVRRQILQDFEAWARDYFVIIDKADSDIPGARGNRERFYLLKKSRQSK